MGCNQVCIPGLHISLGIFFRLFTLLEDEVHCLDYQTVTSSTAQQLAIQAYALNIEKLSSLREEKLQVEGKAAMLEHVLTLSAVNESASFTTTPQLVQAMVKEAAKLRNELQAIVRSSHLLNSTIT